MFRGPRGARPWTRPSVGPLGPLTPWGFSALAFGREPWLVIDWCKNFHSYLVKRKKIQRLLFCKKIRKSLVLGMPPFTFRGRGARPSSRHPAIAGPADLRPGKIFIAIIVKRKNFVYDFFAKN